MSSLATEPLEKAIIQLEGGILEAKQYPDSELMRDGVIQRFEYTVDLSWKLMQRYLKTDLQVEDSAIRSKKDIFREAACLGVISSAERWIAHYELRNSTSHDDDAYKAGQIYAQALIFLPDAKALLETLQHAA